jgi:pyridoxal biosynthesis lyase PdxS
MEAAGGWTRARDPTAAGAAVERAELLVTVSLSVGGDAVTADAGAMVMVGAGGLLCAVGFVASRRRTGFDVAAGGRFPAA